jgi:transcription initiation factor TFIID subunit 7
MLPGEDCDYLRDLIESGKLDTASDVWMEFKEPGKAVLNIRGNLYAAVMMDLPCIIEANKTLGYVTGNTEDDGEAVIWV